MRRTRVYIAGPYTKNDPAENTKVAQELWDRLRKAGYSPYCPHWSHYQHILYPLPYENWLEYDLEWLALCDVMLRIPGQSSGADKEVDYAKALGMTVHYDVNTFVFEVPLMWIDDKVSTKMSLREQQGYRDRLAGSP